MIIQGERRHTYGQVVDRAKRLASYLQEQGLGCRTERTELADHEVGQDLVGMYAYNGPEYVESMLGTLYARTAPFNINYRYVSAELQYLLADAGAAALIDHAAFAPRIAEILPELPHLRVLIKIADDSGNALLDGAVDYETVVAAGNADTLTSRPTPDDLMIIYTGGTTGMPKGVLWRQHDLFVTACGGRDVTTGKPVVDSYEAIAMRVAANPAMKILALPPLIHGAAQWAAMNAIGMGQTIVFPSVVDRLDAEDVVRTIEREKISVLIVVGDAMARPVLEAIGSTGADVSSLVVSPGRND